MAIWTSAFTVEPGAENPAVVIGVLVGVAIRSRDASLQQRCFQLPLALLPIGHQLTNQLEKPRVVIAVLDVAQLVGHHVFDAEAGGAHQVDG